MCSDTTRNRLWISSWRKPLGLRSQVLLKHHILRKENNAFRTKNPIIVVNSCSVTSMPKFDRQALDPSCSRWLVKGLGHARQMTEGPNRDSTVNCEIITRSTNQDIRSVCRRSPPTRSETVCRCRVYIVLSLVVPRRECLLTVLCSQGLPKPLKTPIQKFWFELSVFETHWQVPCGRELERSDTYCKLVFPADQTGAS